MVLVRCQKHGAPDGKTRSYVRSVRPVGYPETAAIMRLRSVPRTWAPLVGGERERKLRRWRSDLSSSE